MILLACLWTLPSVLGGDFQSLAIKLNPPRLCSKPTKLPNSHQQAKMKLTLKTLQQKQFTLDAEPSWTVSSAIAVLV